MLHSSLLRRLKLRSRYWIAAVGFISLFALSTSLLTPSDASSPTATTENYAANRAKLISYVLRNQLARHHYTHKAIDDELSRTAYSLFLKQLDAQKRFLLQSDIDQLKPYSLQIDNEINLGVIELPTIAARIMDQRVLQVQDLVHALLKEEIDFSKNETIETDSDKLTYCRDLPELRERWRKIVKYQLLGRYLNLLEDQKKIESTGDKIDTEIMADAKIKIAKSLDQFFARMLEQEEQDRFDSYFTAVTEAFDPHTNYMPPTQKEDFDISMRGSLEGIGATLREEDGYIKVMQIIPGSAAWRQGELQAEDIILKVAEGKAEAVDITDMRLRDAVSLIRGKKGTEVRLTARKPDGSKIVIPIIRDVVQIDETFARGTTIKDEKNGKTYGYIRIPSFYRDFQESDNGGRNVTDDVRTEIAKLKNANIDGLILDVRNNGGGALADAVSIAGLFISDGPVVQVRSSNGKTQVLNDDDSKIVYNGPLAVLVNEFSASASEILAGALQDYRRAIVIGSAHTHGKGTVQAMLDLDRDINLRNMDQFLPLGALKVTIQKFYRISGGSTQYRGVVPDIILPDRLQHLKSGEQYLDNSLPWDTIEATDYRPWPQQFAERDWLQGRSQQRIKNDPAWQTINKDAARAKERSEKTLAPLQFSKLRRDWLEENKMAEAQRMESGMPKHDEKGSKREPLLTEVDKIKQLGKDTEKDPVAKEAMAVLTDITTHPTVVTRKAIKLLN